LHNGGNPPPSAIAVVTDRASNAAAQSKNRASVFFMDAPFVWFLKTRPEKHKPGKSAGNSKPALAGGFVWAIIKS
jgi:hypothetical protein